MNLKVKLVSGFFIVTLIIALAGFFSLQKSQNELEKAIGESSLLLSSEILDKINRDINNRIVEFRSFSKNFHLLHELRSSNEEFSKLENVGYYIQEIDNKWKSTSPEEITPFMFSILNNSLSRQLKKKINFHEQESGFVIYGEVFVTNRYGANIAQSGKTSDYFQADEDWWQNGRREGIYITDVQFDESAGVHSIDIILRIDDESGEFLGVIKVVLNIAQVVEILTDIESSQLNVNDFESLEFRLLSKDNFILYSSEESERFKNLEDLMIANDITSKKTSGGFFNSRSEDFYAIHKDLDGKNKLFTHAHSKGYKNFNGLDWVLITTIETEELFSPIRDLRGKLLVIFFASILIAILIGFFISNSISRPINELTRIIESISKGKLDVGIDQKMKESNDELGKLARSFDRTIVSLKLAIKRNNEITNKD